MTIKLYDLVGRDDRRFSPACWRIKMALAHKGLAFETLPTPFTKIPMIEGGVTKTVPLLVDGDKVIGDSHKIVHYLDDAYPDTPSVLGGPAAAALTDFVNVWVLSEIHTRLATLLIKDIHDSCLPADQTYFRESREGRMGKSLEAVQEGREGRVQEFRDALRPLRILLERQSYLGGDGPLYADYIVLAAFLWARCSSDFDVLALDDPLIAYLRRLMTAHDGFALKAVERGV